MSKKKKKVVKKKSPRREMIVSIFHEVNCCHCGNTLGFMGEPCWDKVVCVDCHESMGIVP